MTASNDATGTPARIRTPRGKSIIPGRGLTLGFTVLYLSLIVLIPLAGVFFKSAELGWSGFWNVVSAPRVLAALKLSFGAALIGASINAVFGTLIAWVFVRYRFFAKRFFDAIIDLPFALPTAVAGIALTALYAANGWIGQFLEPLGIKVAYTPVGVIVACTFIGLPFVVRTVQPLLEEAERELEEAAASLGATRLQAITRVILPTILPGIITGFTLAFARAAGEYGSIIFIAGNMPMISEIAPLLIIIKLEEFDYAGASAVAVAMLTLSLVLLLIINGLHIWTRSRRGRNR
ncbi:sulfate ABC transporter permease subunit CysT [Sinimarinibacterium thermocellulolyticum]|uniref:Sulfate transport system permease protein CysT n=1 Tax=Sinimarinibacterium thermocellulolyticum TaxID=3170016 RepID=A0ABV2A8B0_9GAMM